MALNMARGKLKLKYYKKIILFKQIKKKIILFETEEAYGKGDYKVVLFNQVDFIP